MPPEQHLPGPLPAADEEGLGLDARIRLAEERLVAREQRVRLHLQEMRQRAAQAVEPRSLLRLGASATMAGAGLVWALRRSPRPRPGPMGPHPAVMHTGAVPQLLLSLLPMALPMLPPRWRNRISPAMAAAVLGVAMPLVGRLLGTAASGRSSDRRAPATVPRLDLMRYAGIWHEQARLPVPWEPACRGQPRVRYSPWGGRLAVLNECWGSDGQVRLSKGVARVVPGGGGARLQLSFMPAWLRWLPLAWTDLWVLHVDESAPDYRVAMAGHPSRKRLWLLSRQAQLPPAELQRLLAVASDLGYDTSRLVLAAPPLSLQ